MVFPFERRQKSRWLFTHPRRTNISGVACVVPVTQRRARILFKNKPEFFNIGHLVVIEPVLHPEHYVPVAGEIKQLIETFLKFFKIAARFRFPVLTIASQ